MSSAVAPAMTTSEHAPSASVASSSSGSKKNSGRPPGGPGGAVGSWRGGVVTAAPGGSRSARSDPGWGWFSLRPRVPGDELGLAPEPLREDQASRRRRRRRAPPAALDRHRDDDRAVAIGHEADVPGLVLLAGPLR